MTLGKAVRKAATLNAVANSNEYVEYDVVGEGNDCYVRQINICRKTGERRYGVAAY